MFRSALRSGRIAALLVVAMIAVACSVAAGPAPSGSPSEPPSDSPSDTPLDRDQVIFRVSWEGGFVMPEAMLGRLPIVVVYADGRVITQGPVLAIYPGPLMPNLQEHTLSQAALDRLIALARENDLLKTVHYDFPGIADAADTVLEINLDGKSYRVSAYALADAGVDTGTSGLAPEVLEGRAALRAFADALTTIPASDFVDQEHPYEISRLQLYAGKAVIVPNSELPGEQPAIDWPLEDLATAGEVVENSPIDVRCEVIEGDELATVLPLLQEANSLSTFRSNGELYSLVVRPLLPSETGC